MRKLVVDLIQPTVLKLNQDRENVAAIKTMAELQKQRVDELESFMLKSGKKQTQFDVVFNQIAESVN